MLTFDDALGLVRTFHTRIQAPIASEPSLLIGHPGKALGACILVGKVAKELAREANGSNDQVLCRAAMCLEELSEWLLAHAQRDLVAAADALGDRAYLLFGDAVATGLPIEAIVLAVHESNMTKMDRVQTGVGKAVKGRSFKHPGIAKIVSQHRPAKLF